MNEMPDEISFYDLSAELLFAATVDKSTINNAVMLMQYEKQVIEDKLRAEVSAFTESLNLLDIEKKAFYDQVFYDGEESYRPRFGIQGLLYRYDPKAKHSEKKAMKGYTNVIPTRKQFMQLKTFKNLRFER